jgi:beta-lactamase class A
MPRGLLPVLVLALGLARGAAAQATAAPGAGPVEILRAQFGAGLQAIAARVDGVASYTIIDLTSGDRFTRHSDLVLPTASTIKLAVLYEFWRQADAGTLAPDTMVPLDRQLAVGGGPGLFFLGTPNLSLKDYATMMVMLSDNTATNVLIRALGMEAINSRMRGLGLGRTKLRRLMLDLDAARRGDENVSTAAEIARLLEILYKGEGLAPKSRDETLALLKVDKGAPTPIQRGVPDGVEVACKPGELEGVRVDAGIVFAKNRPYVFSMMTSFLENDRQGESIIEEASRLAYQYFYRLGASTEYGRLIGR